MTSRAERWFWILAAAVLLALAIPWFLWGSDRLLVGLPVWLWWHILWLALASLLFWAFARRSWGLAITDGDPV